METMIGKVIHHYPKVNVAAIVLSDHLARGDRIHIHEPHDDVRQTVTSMEYYHQPIQEADPGQDMASW